MVLLVAITLAAAAPLKLAAPAFRGSNLSAETARFCTERFADELHQRGMHVTTERDIGALLGLERQKQLLGCSNDASSCMVELAAALGVDGVVLGEVARLGTALVVEVKVLSADGSRRLATASRQVALEEELLGALAAIADDVAAQVAPPEARGRGLGARFFAPAAVGVAAAAAGAVLLGLASARHSSLVTRTGTPFDTMTSARLASEEGTFQTSGWIALGVGVAALVAAVVLQWVVP